MSALQTWSVPPYYAGFSPAGDYVLYTRTRDSRILEESNWSILCAALGAEPYDGGAENFEDRPAVYHWRAGHWAVGWVEYLMIRADAPEATRALAENFAQRLADYPILDDDDYSRREFEFACETWAQSSIRERVDICRHAGISIFAARRDALPSDDRGFIYEHLTAGA